MKDNIKIKGNIIDLGVEEIDICKIERNEEQPRVIFDEQGLRELANSIKRNGLLQPIVVRKVKDKYIIIAGERRYRAHKLLNRDKIKSRVIECDDKTAYELTLLENIQRKDLSLLEEARGYKFLKEKYNYKLEELSKITQKSKSNISNIMSILNESNKVQKYVDDGTLTIAAYVWIKQLPNEREKVDILEKLRKEELKRSDIRKYVEKVVSAYKIASKMGLPVEEVLKRKGKKGRFDIKEDIIPSDFRFCIIGDYGLKEEDIEWLPFKSVLYSAFNIMYNKSIHKQFSRVLLYRKFLDTLFMDCGAFTCMKHKKWDFFSKMDQLIEFYESVKPDVCTSLDIPTFPFLFENWGITPNEALKKTLENAKKLRDWKPSFTTTKLYVLQGTNKEQYLESFYNLMKLGVFDEENVALAFGGIATTSLKNQVEWISYVTSNNDFKKIRKQLKFVHGFGVGNPKRIVSLYPYGVNSFDAVTAIIITNIGGYWLRNGEIVKHIIHESRLTRRIRFYFNLASFVGQLTEQFAKLKGVKYQDVNEPVNFKCIKIKEKEVSLDEDYTKET